MKFRDVISTGLAAVCFFGQTARGAEVEGVHFVDRMRAGEEELQIHGTGLLRYRLFIKAYVAALYVVESFDGDATPSAILADIPRRLEIEYFWSIPADAFVKITIEAIARSVDAETLENLRAPIEQLNGLYQDVEPGDRYALTYVPGIGTELALNGRTRGVVEGADFSSALFSIWLGEHAIDDSLRKQLLTRRKIR
jgi:hypothetical protein